MRVIVADNHVEVRSALILLLGEKPGAKVVGEAKNFQELLRLIKTKPAEYVLLDWELPGGKPEELVAELHALSPGLAIIALSSRPQMRRAALTAGSQNFVCKSDPPETLLAILDSCCQEDN